MIKNESLTQVAADKFDRLGQMPLVNENVKDQTGLGQCRDSSIEILQKNIVLIRLRLDYMPDPFRIRLLASASRARSISLLASGAQPITPRMHPHRAATVSNHSVLSTD